MKKLLLLFLIIVTISCATSINDERRINYQKIPFLYSELKNTTIILDAFGNDSIKIKGKWQKAVFKNTLPHTLEIISGDTLVHLGVNDKNNYLKMDKNLSESEYFEQFIKNRMAFSNEFLNLKHKNLSEGKNYKIFIDNRNRVSLIGIKKNKAVFIKYIYPKISQEQITTFLINFYTNIN